MRRPCPEKIRQALNAGMGEVILAKGASCADATAFALWKKSLKGDPLPAKEMREAIEGKSLMRVELGGASEHGFAISVQYAEPIRTIEARREAIDMEPTPELAESASEEQSADEPQAETDDEVHFQLRPPRK
jgi:hypothetical protein